MSKPKFKIGDDVYVRDPQRFGARCIVGHVTAVSEAGGVHTYSFTDGITGELRSFPEADLGHRPGTPIGALSGRAGDAGFERFAAIARSWGYP